MTNADKCLMTDVSGGLAEAVFFEFALKGFPVDSQQFGGAVFVTLLGIQHFEDMFPFELFERFPVVLGWRLVG
jgi:hypothetical protein